MLKKFLFSAFVLWFLFAFLLPLSASAADERLIIINKASNELAYYENNKLKRIFRVATGKSPSLTPEGNFIIVNKIINRPYYKENIRGGDPKNPLGDRWLGLNARGTWGTTYAIHGNNNASSIGNYVSLGCNRMHNEEVRWLFEQVKVNTPVIIVTEASSFDSIAKANGHKVTETTKGSAPAMTNTLLRLGSSNEEVKILQQTLKNLGYHIVDVSGYFDEATEVSVKNFQTDQNITVDGIVGRETKMTLRNTRQEPATTPVEKTPENPANPVSHVEKNPPATTQPGPQTPVEENTSPAEQVDRQASDGENTSPAEQVDRQASDGNNSPTSDQTDLASPDGKHAQLNPKIIKLIENTLKRFGFYIRDYDFIFKNTSELKE